MELTENQKEFLEKCSPNRWKLSDGKVNIEGNFDCKNMSLNSFNNIQFGEVTGDFDCSNNRLTYLFGAPERVGGNFLCYKNQIRTLKGGPKELGGDFICSDNQLTDDMGKPENIKGYYSDKHNYLYKLDGSSQDSNFCSSFGFSIKQIADFIKYTENEESMFNDFITTIVKPEQLQQAIDKDPAKIAFDLKSVWKKLKDAKKYEKVKYPDDFENYKCTDGQETNLPDLLSDLDKIGLVN